MFVGCNLALFSPILRSHSTKIAGLTKEPWVFSNEVSDILRGIIRQRYNMVPYIYTMAREAYETGLSPVAQCIMIIRKRKKLMITAINICLVMM